MAQQAQDRYEWPFEMDPPSSTGDPTERAIIPVSAELKDMSKFKEAWTYAWERTIGEKQDVHDILAVYYMFVDEVPPTQHIVFPTCLHVAIFKEFFELLKIGMFGMGSGRQLSHCEASAAKPVVYTTAYVPCSVSDMELYNEFLQEAANKFMTKTGRMPPRHFEVKRM